jgi:(p)ppGpp synthase/HD superfamily hydrolase
VSAKARASIRQYLRKQQTEDALSMGTRLLRHALGHTNLDNIAPADIARVVKETKHTSFNALLEDIGLGNELSAIIARRLIGDSESLADTKVDKVAIKGTEGLLMHYSKCCYPIPDDEIVAILNPGKGMMIHQHGCTNIRKLAKEEPQRVLAMEWSDNVEGDFKVSLRVELINHQGTLASLTNTITMCDSNIINLATDEKESNVYFVDMEITTRNRVHFADIMRKIRHMDQVQKVSRHSQNKHN